MSFSKHAVLLGCIAFVGTSVSFFAVKTDHLSHLKNSFSADISETLKLSSRKSDSKQSFELFDAEFEGPVYRSFLQAYRVISQHYVDEVRVRPIDFFVKGVTYLNKSLKGSFFAGSLPVFLEDSQESQGRLAKSLACLGNKNLAALQCDGVSPIFASKDLTTLTKQVLVFEIKSSRFVYVPSQEQNANLQEISASLIQWLKTLNLESAEKHFQGFLNSFLRSLDPHTAFLNEAEYDELKGGTRGQFGGVGVVINEFHGVPFVREIVSNSPAQMAGVEANDIILRVGDLQVSFDETEKVLKKIRSTTAEGPVPVWLYRPKSHRILKTFFSREEIPTKSVETKFIPDAPDVLHIRVTGFSSKTSQEIYDAYLESVSQSKGSLKAMILDLRGNPGGLLDQAVQVSDLFLNKGKIVVTKSRYDTQIEQAAENQLVSLPLIVLINSSSASASEIVAGALKDNGRALVIGERSFGKGSVQSLFELPSYGALKVTIAHYYTPKGSSIQNTGIDPHIHIKLAQAQDDELWIAGSSEQRREEDLLHHLKNPDGDKVSVAGSVFEGHPSHWFWSLTSDDLAEIKTLGKLSFTYPNYENSDFVTETKNDSYIRLSLRVLDYFSSTREGTWGVPNTFQSSVSQVRKRENQESAQSLEAASNPGLAEFFEKKSKPLSKAFPKVSMKVDSNGSLEIKAKKGTSVSLVSLFNNGNFLLGYAAPGRAELPSVWQPVSEMSYNRKNKTIQLQMTDLFWSSWSSHASSNSPEQPTVTSFRGGTSNQSQVEVFIKLSPEHPARSLGLVSLSESAAPQLSLMGLSAAVVQQEANENEEQLLRYKVLVELGAASKLPDKCSSMLVRFVSQSVSVNQLNSTEAQKNGACRSLQFTVEVKRAEGSQFKEYDGMVGLLLRDSKGSILGRAPLVEITNGTVKSLSAN